MSTAEAWKPGRKENKMFDDITIYDLWPLAIPLVFFILLIVMIARQRVVDIKFIEAIRVLDREEL